MFPKLAYQVQVYEVLLFMKSPNRTFGQRNCTHICRLQGVMRGMVLNRSEFGWPNTRSRVIHQPRENQEHSTLQANKFTKCLREKINKTSKPHRRKHAKLSMSSTRSLPYSLVTPSRVEEFQLIDNNRMQTSIDRLCPSAYHWLRMVSIPKLYRFVNPYSLVCR